MAPFSLAQRFKAPLRNGLKLFGVGVGARWGRLARAPELAQPARLVRCAGGAGLSLTAVLRARACACAAARPAGCRPGGLLGSLHSYSLPHPAFLRSFVGVIVTNTLVFMRTALDADFVPLNQPQARGRAARAAAAHAAAAAAAARQPDWNRCATSCCWCHLVLSSPACSAHLKPPERVQPRPSPPQNVLATSLAYGVYMATSSNIRYQVRDHQSGRARAYQPANARPQMIIMRTHARPGPARRQPLRRRELLGRRRCVVARPARTTNPSAPRPLQILAGLIEERGIEARFRGNYRLCAALSFFFRTSNTFIGSLLWVDFVRLLGMQTAAGH